MHFRRLVALKPVMTFIVMHLFLGWAILNKSSIVGALSLLGIYLNLWRILKKRYRIVFISGVLANFVFMETVTIWFASISPAGWLQKIGPLDTRVWLLIVVGVANLLASLAVAVMMLVFRYLRNHNLIKPSALSGIYGFAIFIMASEIIRALFFAIGVHGNNTPFRSFWGIFSSSILIINPLTHNVPSIFGFWGSSFFFSFTVVVTYLLCRGIWQRKNYRTYLFATLVILSVIAASNLLVPKNPGRKNLIHVLAVSRQNHATDYIDALSSAIQKNKKQQTLVVLPEYDNLIAPDVLLPPILANYSRWQKLGDAGVDHTYFAGTQDAFYKDTRYTQNYLVNGQREYLQKNSKQFLVPGGEYVIGWVDGIFQRVDPEAAGAFAKSRGRYAIDNNALQDNLVKDSISKRVAIAACSSTLYPTGFQKAVKNGADVITINISYQQFQHTKQYEQFANTFMDFTTYAYQRPVMSSADYGVATLHTAVNTISYKRDGPLLIAEIPRHKSTPIYVKLGDNLIVGSLLLGTALVVGWQYAKNHR